MAKHKSTEIEKATFDDIPQIVNNLIDWFQPHYPIKVEPDHMKCYIAEMFNKDHDVPYILLFNNNAVGSAFIQVSPFNRNVIMLVVDIIVSNGRDGLKVLSILEQWGKENGAHISTMLNSALVDRKTFDRKIKVINRLGYNPTGFTWQKNLKG